jgi:hypothetical protein
MLVADLAEVHRDRYPPAIFWQPATASRESCPTSNFPSRGEQHCNLVLVGGPLWVGRPALPIRAFLAMRKWPFARTALFLTHIGSPRHRALAEIEALLAALAAGNLALRAKDI